MFERTVRIWSRVSSAGLMFAAIVGLSATPLQPLYAAPLDAHEAELLTEAAFVVQPAWATPKPIVPAPATAARTAKNVRMAGDDDDFWVTVYHTGDPNSDGTQPTAPSRLVVSNSFDDAGSWSTPQDLPKAPSSESEYSFRPDITTDKIGTYLVLYEAATPTGSVLHKTVSVDDGDTWNASVPLGTFASNANPRNVSVDTDGAGAYMAAWVADSETQVSGINIAYSADAGQTWEIKRRIDTTGTARPQVRCDRGFPSRWVITFQQKSLDTDFNAMYTVTEDEGATWATLELNTDAGSENRDDFAPRIDYGVSNNTWGAVWIAQRATGEFDVYASQAFQNDYNAGDGGLTWSAPVLISQNEAIQSLANADAWIATDDAGDIGGNWMVVWSAAANQIDANPPRKLYTSSSDDGAATWNGRSILNDDLATSDPRWMNPVIDSNLRGRWLAMWENGPGSPQTAGSPTTAVPWYSTTFLPLDDQYLDVVMTATLNNTGDLAINQPFSITYTVTNNGPLPATDVELLVRPSAASIQVTGFADVTGVVENPQTGAEFTGTYSNIAAGESFSFTLTFSGSAPGNFTISGDARPLEIDANQGNNINVRTAVELKDLTPVDLAVTKSAYPTPAVVGEYLGYTITVRNNSAFDATNVTVTDPLPPEVAPNYASVSQGSWNFNSATSTITADFGTIKAGARATLVIAVTPRAGFTGATNTACASTTSVDTDPSNNCATAAVTFGGGGSTGADLAILKTVNANPSTAGTSVTYSLLITNSGPNAASGVVVTDVLPPSLTYNGEFHTRGTVSRSGQTVTANLGTMAANSSARVNISVIPTVSGTVSNTATVSSSVTDPATGNNSATAVMVVNAADPNTVANLSVVKSASPSTATVGSTITYTVQVSNAGPSAATNVVVQDSLPAQVVFVSSVPTESSYSNGVVRYGLGSLASGSSATYQIVTRAIAAGTAVNTASVSSDNPDLAPSNNTHSISTVITGGGGGNTNADLALSSSIVPSPASTGNAITWSLTARNNGPQSAANIVVSTVLPPTVTFVSATGPNGSATPSGSSLSVPITVLGPGATANISIILVPMSQGSLTLSASITGSVNDTVPANNTASTTVQVNAGPAFDLQGTWTKFKVKGKTGPVPNWSIKGSFGITNLRSTLVVSVPVQFYLSDDTSYSPNTDTLIRALAYTKIKPGKTKKKSVKTKVTFDPTGKYLLAVINPTGTEDQNVVPILVPITQ